MVSAGFQTSETKGTLSKIETSPGYCSKDPIPYRFSSPERRVKGMGCRLPSARKSPWDPNHSTHQLLVSICFTDCLALGRQSLAPRLFQFRAYRIRPVHPAHPENFC